MAGARTNGFSTGCDKRPCWIIFAFRCLGRPSLHPAMEIIDILLAPLFIGLLFWVGYSYGNSHYKGNKLLMNYYNWGLALKLLGAFFYVLVYVYFYKAGDTLSYFKGGKIIHKAFMEDPGAAVSIYFLEPKEETVNTQMYTKRLPYFNSSEGFFMHKMCGIFALMTFKSYLCTSFFFAFYNFTGAVKLFDTFRQKFPKFTREIAIGAFFVPSVIFWGSGISKDTVCMGSIGWLFYAFDNLFSGKKIAKSAFLVVLMSYLIITLKAYILMTFMPAVLIWFYLRVIGSVKNKVLKAVSAVVMLVAIAGGGTVMVQFIAQASQKYALDRVQKLAEGFWSYHTHLDETGETGSGYQLHITDASATGMLKVMPEAVNVTLFRPYLWEVRNPFMLLSALESLILFVMFLRLFPQIGFGGFFRSFSVPEVTLCILFSIVLGFAVGVTAFNFGALVRFKIPLMPFFYIGLILMRNYKTLLEAPKKVAKKIRSKRKPKASAEGMSPSLA